MTPTVRAWLPVAVLATGCLLTMGDRAQLRPQLRHPLAQALPSEIEAMVGTDATVEQDVAEVAGFSDYALRIYENPDTVDTASRWASIYLGFYDHQTRGHTIHSPKNCLPGSGWEALDSGPEDIRIGTSTVTVNRYLLQNGETRALVLYWYQGRGRVAFDEYRVKWDLLRDAIVKRRTDEALVRIVVPITGSTSQALALARGIAVTLKPAVDRALPL